MRALLRPLLVYTGLIYGFIGCALSAVLCTALPAVSLLGAAYYAATWPLQLAGIAPVPHWAFNF